MRSRMHRRQFLKSGLSWGAVGSGMLGMLGRQSEAQVSLPGTKKLLFIFQRGGNDGINTVLPHGDPHYSTVTRPSLYISPGQSIDLGNGFAGLHPSMAPAMEVFNSNGTGVPGDLAVIHRVAYANQSRSHFDSQDYWERGVPDDLGFDVKDGMFYRQLQVSTDLGDPTNAFLAASVANSGFIGLKGATPFPNFTRASQFDFEGDEAERLKFRGSLPGENGSPSGRGILGLYGGTGLGGRTPSGVVHATGLALGNTLTALGAANGAYVEEPGAIYPAGSFGDRLRECAMLFKNTGVQILGVDTGGHDTHTNQGAVNGSQANNLNRLAMGFQALHTDLQGQWDDLIIVTMTEFGRTSEENGSNGTDHAEASVMFVAGGGVNGGVYNCDPATWETGATQEESAMFSKRGRYLGRKTDFRAVFGEIFTKHFGDSREDLNTVIPGYDLVEEDYPSEMSMLGIMG